MASPFQLTEYFLDPESVLSLKFRNITAQDLVMTLPFPQMLDPWNVRISLNEQVISKPVLPITCGSFSPQVKGKVRYNHVLIPSGDSVKIKLPLSQILDGSLASGLYHVSFELPNVVKGIINIGIK